MYDQLVLYCSQRDVIRAEALYNTLKLKINDYIIRIKASMQMTELYIKLDEYKKARAMLIDTSGFIKAFKPTSDDFRPQGKYYKGASVNLPIFGEVKLTKDQYIPDYEKERNYKEANKIRTDLYNTFRASAIALEIIVSIYLGVLHRKRHLLTIFKAIEKQINPSLYESLYVRIEDAKIIDYLKKSSTLIPFPKDDQVQDAMDPGNHKIENEIYDDLSLSIPSELRYLLTGDGKLLLHAQNVLLLPATPGEQKTVKEENTSVGKKVLRALRNALFDKICENKSFSKLVANSSVMGVFTPLFREAGITNLVVIATTITAVTQFGLDFLCKLKDEFFSK